MRIEWRNDIDTLLSISLFSHLDLLIVIENAPDLDRFHRPIVLKFVYRGATCRPNMLRLVRWGDISGLLGELCTSTLSFDLLLSATAILVLRSLMHED